MGGIAGKPRTRAAIGGRRVARLAAAGRDLAAAHVGLATTLAERYARKCPREYETFLSAAMLGLCHAAAAFDPGRGVGFVTFATHRIKGAILDAARAELPKGFRRNRAHSPKLVPLAALIHVPKWDRWDAIPSTASDVLPADELPVGWEVESEDAVAALTARLPAAHRRVVRLLYARADAATMKRVGRLIGRSESLVSLVHKTACATLRDSGGRP